jgi:hypothetical protein
MAFVLLFLSSCYGANVDALMMNQPWLHFPDEFESGKHVRNLTVSNLEVELHVIASLATSVLKQKPISEENGHWTCHEVWKRAINDRSYSTSDKIIIPSNVRILFLKLLMP